MSNICNINFSYLRQENSTGRGVPTFSVWYRAWLSGTVAWLSGTGRPVLPFVLLTNCSFTSVIMTLQRNAQRFPQRQRVVVTFYRNIIGIILFKMHISMRYEKNNQVPVLDPDRQISVSGDTMSHPSLGYRLDWYL